LGRSALSHGDRRSALFVFGAAIVGFLLLVGGAVVVSDLRAEPATSEAGGGYRGSEPPVSIELPEFELHHYQGGRIASGDLSGQVVVLTLLDSQCTDVCPILASVIARTLDSLTALERKQVRAIAVSGDPAEDTPASVRRFLAARRADGRLEYILGDEREMRPLWTALQLLPSLDTGRDMLHSAPVRIYDREGVWVATLHAGADLSEANLLHDIRVALGADTSAG
jgi:cytochrome oxidase Cu insertion factor (SCO1/SenC/PrrC family)